MVYDVGALRAQFPSLDSGIAHFDGPGGTQTPQPVADAMVRTLTGPLSNRGTATASERNAEKVVGEFRSAYADFLGATPTGIVYGRSATQLCYDFSRHLAKTWRPGDEVVVSRLDHDSNVSPWVQAAAAAGVTVRWIDIDAATMDLDRSSIAEAVTPRTRLVAVTAASNVLGTMPDVRAVADAAHAVGALVWVDGVHYAAHRRMSMAALGADVVVCSPYKFLGPHCGVLAASPELLESLHPDKLVPSTNAVPERFEYGTLPYEVMAGATAAVDFLAAIDPGDAPTRAARLTRSLLAVEQHETAVCARIEAGIEGLDLQLLSTAAARTPTLLMTSATRAPDELRHGLAARGVAAPAGDFYARQAFDRLGLSAALRAGVAPYTDDSDADRLVQGLASVLQG